MPNQIQASLAPRLYNQFANPADQICKASEQPAVPANPIPSGRSQLSAQLPGAAPQLKIDSADFQRIDSKALPWLRVTAPAWMGLEEKHLLQEGAQPTLAEKAESISTAVQTTAGDRARGKTQPDKLEVVLSSAKDFDAVTQSAGVKSKGFSVFLQSNGVVVVNDAKAFVPGTKQLTPEAARQLQAATTCHLLRKEVQSKHLAITLPSYLEYGGKPLSTKQAADHFAQFLFLARFTKSKHFEKNDPRKLQLSDFKRLHPKVELQSFLKGSGLNERAIRDALIRYTTVIYAGVLDQRIKGLVHPDFRVGANIKGIEIRHNVDPKVDTRTGFVTLPHYWKSDVRELSNAVLEQIRPDYEAPKPVVFNIHQPGSESIINAEEGCPSEHIMHELTHVAQNAEMVDQLLAFSKDFVPKGAARSVEELCLNKLGSNNIPINEVVSQWLTYSALNIDSATKSDVNSKGVEKPLITLYGSRIDINPYRLGLEMTEMGVAQHGEKKFLSPLLGTSSKPVQPREAKQIFEDLTRYCDEAVSKLLRIKPPSA